MKLQDESPADPGTDRRPILKRMEDFADSPLVPALLAQIHADSDQTLLKVCYSHQILVLAGGNENYFFSISGRLCMRKD